MRLTKLKNPKNKKESSKQSKINLISNYQNNNKESENIILDNIIPKNSSLNNLREKIEKESNSNIKDIFSSDESRLKAIKYVIQATNKENKEHQKNEILKLKQNLNYNTQNIPLSFTQKNKNNEKITNSFYKKIKKISPIKRTDYKSNYIKNEHDLTDSPMKILFQRNRINSNNVISQSEVNIQYIQNENKTEIKPNKDNLFYHKVQYIRKTNNKKRDRSFGNNYNNNKSNRSINDIDSKYTEKKVDNFRNRTINNFYVHKQINKSGLFENNNKTCNNNIKKYNNNNQGINVFYSTKNINYDIMYNFQENDSNNHNKNISQDEYYNFLNYNNLENKTFFNKKAKKVIHNSLYIPEVDNESDTNQGENNFYKINYITKANQIHLGQKKKKPIIRIIDKSCYRDNYENDGNNYYYRGNRNISPNDLNKPKDKTFNGYNNSDNFEQLLGNYTYNNDFSFHKKITTNIHKKSNIGYISNIDNNYSNNIVFKKKSIKDNPNINSDINKKFNRFTIYLNDFFSIISNNKNKIIFENENDIIDYINEKFNKENKSKNENNYDYTGFSFTKKYKGKTIFEINLYDDINKFNKILKEKNIKIGNKYIEIISINDKENIEIIKKKIINLENEIERIKQENEALNKKDFLKNELIKKLDKEKQNILEENNKVLNKINELKTINDELNLQIIQLNSEKNKEKNITNKLKEEKIIKLDFLNKHNEIIGLSSETKKEEIKTLSSNEQSNNLNSNINNNIMENPLESKKTNPISIFRLSKVSEIKKVDNSIDSDKKEIKNNLELLNEKVKNSEKNNSEINFFGNKDF